MEYVEETWEDNEEEGDFGYLLSGNCLPDKDLSKAQQFVDAINRILTPIADQCTIHMNHSIWSNREAPDPAIPSLDHCFYDPERFGVASFVWEDRKLKLVGTLM